jgi:hypothetical protein
MGLQLEIARVIKGAGPPAGGNGNGWIVQSAQRGCYDWTEGEEYDMALHDSGCMNCQCYLLCVNTTIHEPHNLCNPHSSCPISFWPSLCSPSIFSQLPQISKSEAISHHPGTIPVF